MALKSNKMIFFPDTEKETIENGIFILYLVDILGLINIISAF